VRSELLRFAVVGGVGFVVDAGVLHLLVSGAGWSPYTARAVSFPLALGSTFFLNRAWTFQGLRTSALRAYGIYTVVQAIGALLNLFIFLLCLLVAPPLHDRPVIALAVGAGIALVFNFWATRNLVFRPLSHPAERRT
jgi:putative flippase GtrA